jgi:hypothetical protein
MKTKKRIYQLKYPKTTVFLGGGGKQRRSMGEEGFFVFSSDIRLADGTEYDGFVELDETSSGEHWGTGIILADGKLVWQDAPDFLEQLGKTKEEVFPYRYRPRVEPRCYDHHRGDDGWSI